MIYSDYLNNVATEMGVSLWLLVVIFIWTLFWKISALWKSARKGQFVWFIFIMIFNTVGILPILYIYVFSKIKNQKDFIKRKPLKKKNVKKKVVKKRSIRKNNK